MMWNWKQCPSCGELAVEPLGDEFECQACGRVVDGLYPDPVYPIEEDSVVS